MRAIRELITLARRGAKFGAKKATIFLIIFSLQRLMKVVQG
jgi:hypothetical protein